MALAGDQWEVEAPRLLLLVSIVYPYFWLWAVECIVLDLLVGMFKSPFMRSTFAFPAILQLL